MFELASRLVGVYKVNHMTKSVTIENRDYIREAPKKAPADREGKEMSMPLRPGSSESQKA